MKVYSIEEIEVFVHTNHPQIVDVDWCSSMTESKVYFDFGSKGTYHYELVSYRVISDFIKNIQLCSNLKVITDVIKNQFKQTFHNYDSVEYIDIHGETRTYSSTITTFGESTAKYISLCYQEAHSRALLYNKIKEKEIKEEQKYVNPFWEDPYFPAPQPPSDEESYHSIEETPPQEEPKPDVRESSEITAKDIENTQTQDCRINVCKKIVNEETVSEPNSPKISQFSIESLDSIKREFFNYLRKIGKLDKQFIPTIKLKQKRNTYWWCLCKFLGIPYVWETLQLITHENKNTIRRAYNNYINKHPGFENMLNLIEQDYNDFKRLQKCD